MLTKDTPVDELNGIRLKLAEPAKPEKETTMSRLSVLAKYGSSVAVGGGDG